MVVVVVVVVFAAQDRSHVDNEEAAVTWQECVHLLLQVPAVAELHLSLVWRVILVASVGSQVIGKKIVRNI